MSISKKNIYRVGKRLVQIVLGAMLLLLLVLGIGWYTLRLDHPYIIRQIQEVALKEWDANLEVEGYKLQWIRPFSLLHLQVRGLKLAATDHAQIPVLRINGAISAINPWDWIGGNRSIQSVSFDSVWVHIYKDIQQKRNLSFIKHPTINRPGQPTSTNPEFPTIEINYLDFHHQDDFHHKWQRANFSHPALQVRRDEQQEWIIDFKSKCFFEGLVFKAADGGFLRNTSANVDLHFSTTKHGKTLQLTNSSLSINQQEYLLQGQLHRADTNQLQLQISNKGVTLSEVRPLLSDKLKKALSDLQIDQAIRTQFSLDNLLVPGRKGVIEVDFFTADANVQYKDVHLTSTTLQGEFSNDCDQDKVGDSITSCITFDQLDGAIFDVLPIQLKGQIYQLNEPEVKVFGKIDMDIARLNTLLAPRDKITFTSGHAAINFQYNGQLMNILKSPFEERGARLKGDATFENFTIAPDQSKSPLPALSGRLFFDEKQSLLEDISLEWMGTNIRVSGTLGNWPKFLFYDDQALESDLSLHFDQVNLGNFNDSTSSAPKQRLDFIFLENFTQRIASNINGEIQLEIDKLIYDTLFLTELKTRFQLYPPRHLLYTDSAMIKMDQLNADFMGTTPLSIDLSLFQDSISQLRADINLPTAVQPLNFFLPKSIEIMEGDLKLQVSAQVPLRSIFTSEDLRSELRYQGLVQFDQIDLEMSTFPWPIRKISGPLAFDNEQVLFKGLQFQYEDSPFFLAGSISNYASFTEEAPKASVDLNLRGDYLDLRETATSSKKSTTNKSLSPPEFFRSLDTVFHYASGKIQLQLDSVLTKAHTINPFLMEAQLLPDKATPDQHRLVVDSIYFGFGANNSIKGSAFIANPAQPTIDAHFETRMKFDQLGRLLPSAYVEMQEGYFTMNMDYQAPLYDGLDAKNYILKAKIKGEAELVNGKIFYNYRDFTFDNIYSHLTFDQNALYIRDLDLKVNGNRLIASGHSEDFFPFFILPDHQAQIDLEIASPYFDFGTFTAPQGLGKDTVPIATDTTENALQQTVGYIDQLLDGGSLAMSTKFDEVVYNQFIARNIEGNIGLAPDSVQLKELRMNVADGSFIVDGLISDIIRHQPKMDVALQLDKNNVQEIFRQFEDFGQKELSYLNIEGLASADIRFKADVNSNYSILPRTMYGDVGVKLTGGQLIDVNALKKLSGFLFRKRQLDHILIDTLELFTHIRGSDLYVDNFYLHSSSFDFGAEGVYSLGKDKKTRILFAVPIRNLFRRHISQEEMSKGNSERKGLRLLIEARYKKDRMRFRWKPFVFGKRKYRLVE